MFDVANLLAHQPVPAGNRVGILTNAGGPAILAADACQASGLELPQLSDATVDELRSFLPAAASVANPVDMIASAPAEYYRRAASALLADDQIDSLIVIFIPPLVTAPDEVAAAIVDGEGRMRKVSRSLQTSACRRSSEPSRQDSHLSPFLKPPRRLWPRNRVRRVESREPRGVIPSFDDVRRRRSQGWWSARFLSAEEGWLSPVEAGDLLQSSGVPVVANAPRLAPRRKPCE